MIMGRQILYAIGIFLVLFVGLNLRVFITDHIIKDRGWSFKKHWKFIFIIALIAAIVVFIYLIVTGQTQL
jgi:hypothetical protein